MNEQSVSNVYSQPTNELGLMICKVCAQVVGSIPTNGYKKIYVVCDNDTCSGSAGDIDNEQ